MPDQNLPAAEVIDWLERHRGKSLLRFITCGSVDDGKSTLIGRLLYDSRMILDDQMEALEADSRRVGTQGGSLDFALLVDGLAAEREQGITIDVAYRFFSTERRKFIVADTPGHEQYTRNMVTGASTADLAVLLVDARKGILEQTRRHACLVNLIGIRHLVLAVNKMDLVDWSQETFDAIVADFARFSALLAPSAIVAIPISGLAGDNIAQPSANTPWYRGPTLIAHLETVEIDPPANETGRFRMPVQWVNRPGPDFRGFAGLISAGAIRVGDRVRALPSGRVSNVARIVLGDRDLPTARAGMSVTLTLTDEIDVSRGDVLASADDPPEVADQFEITLVWMAAEPMLPGRRYLVKLGTRTVSGQITALKHKLNVETLEHVAAKSLALNEIAHCNLSLESPVAFEPYARDRDLGGLILIDRETDATLAAGTIRFALRRAHNIHWQSLDVTRDTRATRKGQRPAVLWFTGLSGAGKSTIANLLDRRLTASGHHTVLLDGDNVRHGLNRDLGFSDADRVENIRRVAEVARLMTDAGLIVLVSFISPFRSERDLARSLMAPGEFFEIHVATDLATAEARDPKGLYAKARRGELAHFTGIDSPYEPPEHPELVLDAVTLEPEAAVERVMRMLRTADRFGPPA